MEELGALFGGEGEGGTELEPEICWVSRPSKSIATAESNILLLEVQAAIAAGTTTDSKPWDTVSPVIKAEGTTFTDS